MSVHLFTVFCVTVLVASIIPGPSMLLALTHGVQHGARKTLASAMGNVTVTLVQAGISIAGLGAMLTASEPLFQTMKWAGAAYLTVMGIRLFRSSSLLMPQQETRTSKKSTPLLRLYLQAALVTAGNPKAILFFAAVFPQFMDPGTDLLHQCGLLLSVCAVSAFSCFMLYAVCGERIASLFSHRAMGRSVNRIIGGTFIGAGISLAASNR